MAPLIDRFTASFDKLTEKFATWVDQAVLMLPNFVVALIIVILFVLLARLTRKLSCKTLDKITDNVAIVRLLSNVLYISVVVVGIFIGLGVLQLDKTVTSLLAGVGVVGLALGFAFQTTAANFISGVFMAARHPINVGDIVETSDFFGTVETIDMRFTKVLTPQGQTVIIPNKTILENPLVNYTISGERRVDLACGVSYGDNLLEVRKTAIKAIEDHVEYNRRKPVDVIFTEFGDSSINFILRFWTNYKVQKEFLETQSEAIIAIQQAFQANDITIPFPIRTLDFGIKGGQKLNEVISLAHNSN